MKRAYVVGAAWLAAHRAAFEALDHELLAFDFEAAAVHAHTLSATLSGVASVEIGDDTLDAWFDGAKREAPEVARLLAHTHLDTAAAAMLTAWLDARPEPTARQLVSASRAVAGSCLVLLESNAEGV